MAKIGRDFDAGDRNETDARILYLALDDLTELDTKLFFNSIDSSSVHGLHNFDIALNHAFRRRPLGLFGRFLQYFLQETFVWPDSHDTHLRPLPQVLMIDFRNRHVEFRSQPVLQPPYDHPLVLERLCVGQMDVEGEKSNCDHFSTWGPPTSGIRPRGQ